MDSRDRHCPTLLPFYQLCLCFRAASCECDPLVALSTLIPDPSSEEDYTRLKDIG